MCSVTMSMIIASGESRWEGFCIHVYIFPRGQVRLCLPHERRDSSEGIEWDESPKRTKALVSLSQSLQATFQKNIHSHLAPLSYTAVRGVRAAVLCSKESRGYPVSPEPYQRGDWVLSVVSASARAACVPSTTSREQYTKNMNEFRFFPGWMKGPAMFASGYSSPVALSGYGVVLRLGPEGSAAFVFW
jgi:hypothetical protein